MTGIAVPGGETHSLAVELRRAAPGEITGTTTCGRRLDGRVSAGRFVTCRTCKRLTRKRRGREPLWRCECGRSNAVRFSTCAGCQCKRGVYENVDRKAPGVAEVTGAAELRLELQNPTPRKVRTFVPTSGVSGAAGGPA